MAAPVTSLVPRRRARLGAYTRWQLRDYVLNRGAPTIIVALLIGYLGVSSMLAKLSSGEGPPARLIRQYGSIHAAHVAMRHDLSIAFVTSFIGFFAFLGALFAMNGIVSNDRKLGFYRFLFAKPVTPAAYYGTEFMVNGLCFLVVTCALALLYGAIVEPVLSAPLLIAITAGYLCYAGLGFALSAASRWDWLSLVVVAGAADVLWMRYGASASPFAVLLHLLPPVNRTSAIYAAATGGMALPWQSVLWLAGYGAIAFVAGLAILRHRRLAFN
jgi:ABC-type transport system involved in multi-copper enzyme maturation permease subunit